MVLLSLNTVDLQQSSPLLLFADSFVCVQGKEDYKPLNQSQADWEEFYLLLDSPTTFSDLCTPSDAYCDTDDDSETDKNQLFNVCSIFQQPIPQCSSSFGRIRVEEYHTFNGDYSSSRDTNNNSDDYDVLCPPTPISAALPHFDFEVITCDYKTSTHSELSMFFFNELSFLISKQEAFYRAIEVRCGVNNAQKGGDTTDCLLDVSFFSAIRALNILAHAIAPRKLWGTLLFHCKGLMSVLYFDNILLRRSISSVTSSGFNPFALAVANDKTAVPCTRQIVTNAAHFTLSGYKNLQEDAVCIHEQVAFPQEHSTSYEGLLPSTYNVYGVFDGHNGDRLSELASLYLLEHLKEALSRELPQFILKKAPSRTTDVCATGECNSDNASENNNNNNNDNSKCKKHYWENSELEVIPPQRFLSSALVQTLIHVDRTLYDTTYNADRCGSGTTASIAAFYHGMSTLPNGLVPCYLSIANLGDSRAVLARISDGHVIISTFDHRVRSYPSEKERVEQSGGSIELDRIDGTLEVTRSLGNFIYKLPPDQWLACLDVSGECNKQSEFGEFFADATNSLSYENGIGHVNSHDFFKEGVKEKTMVIGTEPSAGFLGINTAESPHIKKDLVGFESSLTSNVVSNIADIYEAELVGDEFLLLATDGLWDCMGTEEVVDFVRTRLLQLKSSNTSSKPHAHANQSALLLPKSSGYVNVVSNTFLQNTSKKTPSSFVSNQIRGVSEPGSNFLNFCSCEKEGDRNNNSNVVSSDEDGSYDSTDSSHDYYCNSNDNKCGKSSSNSKTNFVYCDSEDMSLQLLTPLQKLNNFMACSELGERKIFFDTPRSFHTPRQSLRDVTNSLANHVVHNLRGSDNVTVMLIIFSSEEY